MGKISQNRPEIQKISNYALRICEAVMEYPVKTAHKPAILSKRKGAKGRLRNLDEQVSMEYNT